MNSLGTDATAQHLWRRPDQPGRLGSWTVAGGSIAFGGDPGAGDYQLIANGGISPSTEQLQLAPAAARLRALDGGGLGLPRPGRRHRKSSGGPGRQWQRDWAAGATGRPPAVPISGTATFGGAPGAQLPSRSRWTARSRPGPWCSTHNGNGYTLAETSGGPLTLGEGAASISVLSGTHTVASDVCAGREPGRGRGWWKRLCNSPAACRS